LPVPASVLPEDKFQGGLSCQHRLGAQEKDRVLTFIALFLAAGAAQGYITFLPFVLIVVVFYFMLIRPNQNRQKKWQDMLSKLKPGDKVTTTGGLRGTILSIKEDAIQLRIPPDNVKVEVIKTAIASVTTQEEVK
jgi:preprotein translocase subunit YajC